MVKILKWVVAAFGIVFLLLVVIYWQWVMFAFNQKQMFLPASFDNSPPEITTPLSSFNILSISKTNGYRHHDAIPAAKALLSRLAEQNAWSIYQTENGAVANKEQLDLFDVVVLNNVSGSIFTHSQKQAFRDYVEGGGGIVAIHASGGDPYWEWDWWADELIRAQFVDHPMKNHIQQATLNIESSEHPIVSHIGSSWVRSDEWYNFEDNPRDRVNVLMTIDESTYDPETSPMGEDHPMVWWHTTELGRVVYSALGHVAETYTETKYEVLLEQAIIWAGEPNSEHLIK